MFKKHVVWQRNKRQILAPSEEKLNLMNLGHHVGRVLPCFFFVTQRGFLCVLLLIAGLLSYCMPQLHKSPRFRYWRALSKIRIRLLILVYPARPENLIWPNRVVCVKLISRVGPLSLSSRLFSSHLISSLCLAFSPSLFVVCRCISLLP